MVDGERIAVLEFNARFGDPECEPLMMRFEGDLAETLLHVTQGHLDKVSFRISPRSAASVILASGGYPGEYNVGVPITGLERIDGAEPSEMKVKWAIDKVRVKVFHAGTTLRDGQLVTDGGRVLAVTAMAEKLERAVAAAYGAAEIIHFEGKQMRRDIARRALGAAGSVS
jgi:phosphoribosylamine---glycine ligase